MPPRKISHNAKTNETEIEAELNLTARVNRDCIHFFDHMLETNLQTRQHDWDLKIRATGDLHIDEHDDRRHTAPYSAKRLIWRCRMLNGALRFTLAGWTNVHAGRRRFRWAQLDCLGKRNLSEMIGKMPTEMFFSFLQVLYRQGAQCNLNIKPKARTSITKIEADFFKAFAAVKWLSGATSTTRIRQAMKEESASSNTTPKRRIENALNRLGVELCFDDDATELQTAIKLYFRASAKRRRR